MFTLRWIWGFVLLALLATGCVAAPPPSTPMPLCTPDARDANPYDQPTDSMAGAIHAYSISASPGDTSTQPVAQHEAFALLIHEVRTWSDYVDIPVANDLIIRITITFISPKLVEGAILSQILYSHIPVADFAQSVKDGQGNIAQRDELVFLVTITASRYTNRLTPDDSLLIQIPVNDMRLTNADGLSVGPRHHDEHLTNQLNLYSEPEHGYVAFPIAVESNEICNWLVDPRWTTSLSLHVDHLYINDGDYGPQTWSMDYQPLIELDTPINVPTFSTPVPGENAYYSPLNEAPLVENGRSKSEKEYWDAYWNAISRFIWYNLMYTRHN